MTRRLLTTLLAATVLLVACDDDPMGPQVGSLALIINFEPLPNAAGPAAATPNVRLTLKGKTAEQPAVIDEEEAALEEAELRGLQDGKRKPTAREVQEQPAAASGTPLLSDGPLFDAALFDGVQAIIRGGPGDINRTLNLTLEGGNWTGSLSGLAVGSGYSVAILAQTGGAVTHYGERTGLSISAGDNSATVSAPPFVTSSVNTAVSQTVTAEVNVNWSAVSAATGYTVQWADNPSFTSASAKTVTSGTSTTVGPVQDVGTHFVRVRATNAAVSNGAFSSAASWEVLPDQSTPPPGDDSNSAGDLGFSPSTLALTQLNILPSGDQDWFAVTACWNDRLVTTVSTAGFTPASALTPTVTYYHESALGTAYATGDVSLDETVPLSGVSYVVIRGSGSTVGAYNVTIDVVTDVANTGTDCSVQGPGEPTELAFTVPTSAVTPGTPFTATVEARNLLGGVASDFTGPVTIELTNNTGALLAHASGWNDLIIEIMDPITPALSDTDFWVNSTSATIQAMMYDPANGLIYAGDNLNDLYTIDPSNGAMVLVGNMGTLMKGLIQSSSPGFLLGVAHDGSGAYLINKTNGSTSYIGPVNGITTVGFRGGALDPTTGMAYVASIPTGGNGGFWELVAIDTASGNGSVVGNFSENGVATLAFLPDGTLLAATGNGAQYPERLWTVDKTSGAMTIRSGLGRGDDGEAIAAIPATIAGTFTVNAVGGVATFTDLVLDAPGTGYTLGATATVASGDLTVSSPGFDVGGGTYVPWPADVRFTAAPSPTARQTFDLTMEVVDVFGTVIGGGTAGLNDSPSIDLWLDQQPGALIFRNAGVDSVSFIDPRTPDEFGIIQVGPTVGDPMNAMTYDPSSSRVYGLENWTCQLWYTIPDGATPWTPVGNPGCLNALDFDAGGRLIGAGGSSIYEIDPGTGAATLLGTLTADVPVSTFHGLAVHPATGVAYGVISGGDLGIRSLLAIDLNALSGTLIDTITNPYSSFPVATYPAGLTFTPDGTLYVSSGRLQSSGPSVVGMPSTLFTVNLSTAELTPLLKLDPAGGSGLAAIPPSFSGGTSAVASGGVANFTGLVIDAAAPGYWLAATANDYPSTGEFRTVYVNFDVDGGTPDLSPVAVRLTPDQVALPSVGGYTAQLSAEAFDFQGNPASTSFAWASTNTGVAQVDGSGLVTIVGAGTAYVYATASNGARGAALIYGQAPTAISVQPSGLALRGIGDMGDLYVEILDQNNIPIDPGVYGISWSALRDVVGVPGGVLPGTDPGTVTANRDGQVLIEASALGLAGYAVVTVSVPGLAPADVFQVQPDIVGAQEMYTLWAADQNTMFGGGWNGYRFRGPSFVSDGQAVSNSNFLRSWGTNASDVWLSGAGDLQHWSGGAWTSVSSPATPFWAGIWGSEPGRFWVTDGPRILYFDGAAWDTVYTGGSSLFGIWGSSQDDIWAVGSAGTILHYDGAQWLADPQSGTVTGTTLYDVWGTGPGEAVAVGVYSFLVYANGVWTEVGTPSQVCYSVWGTASDDVYAACDLGIVRWDGGFLFDTWGSSTGAFLVGIGGAGADVWSVGRAGPELFRGYRGASVAVSGPGTINGNTAFSATVSDASSNPIGNVSLQWLSGDPSIATVNMATGVVSPVAEGTTSIHARALGGAESSASVTVQKLAYGEPIDLGDYITWNGGFYFAQKVTIPNTTLVTDLGMIAQAAGTGVVLSLYTHDAVNNKPNVLVLQTNEFIVDGPGVFEAPVGPVQIAAGTYWLAAHYQSSTWTRYTGPLCGSGSCSTETVEFYYLNVAYNSVMQSPFPVGTLDAVNYGRSNWYLKGFDRSVAGAPPASVTYMSSDRDSWWR